jgi:hypothetical protein
VRFWSGRGRGAGSTEILGLWTRRPCDFATEDRRSTSGHHQRFSSGVPVAATERVWFVDRGRLTCAHCGLARDSDQRGVWGRPVDPCFGLPLWLQADFRGYTVWAYNARHLQTLRDYVAADQRERGNTPICPGGPRSESMSMIEKLPAWMKAARNRERVLTVFESLLARSDEID